MSKISSTQTAGSIAGAARNACSTTENAEGGAASAKSLVSTCNVPRWKNAPPASPETFSVRIMTDIPASLAEKIEEVAQRRGVTRSAVLTECLSIGLSAMNADSDGTAEPLSVEG